MSRKKKTFFPTHHLFSLGRWFYLLHAIIFLLFLYPYLEVGSAQQYPWILTCANSLIVFSMIYAVSDNYHQFVTGCSLGIPVLISYIMPYSHGVQLMSLSSTVFLYGYTMLILITHLISNKETRSQMVFGAASLYFLLGLTWAYLFQLIEVIYPGSFYVDANHNIDGIVNWSDFLYFSFTTLTTLGYGDMSPVSAPARSLSIMEAVTGVMFMGVMISRVVCLSMQENMPPPLKKPALRDIDEKPEVRKSAPKTGLVEEDRNKMMIDD